MPCIHIRNGIITMPDAAIDMAPYGAKVFMEFHDYLGPSFFRSATSNKELYPTKRMFDALDKWLAENPRKPRT